MAVQDTLSGLAGEVTRAVTVAASASALLRGIADRIQAAVTDAIAGGATAEQLAPIQGEVDALRASNDDLAAAVVAGTGAPA